MTEPFYNGDLIPGMIMDLQFKVPYHDFDLFLQWLNTHMTGPFMLRTSSTAHYYEHVQVSNLGDAAKVQEAFGAQIWTQTIRGWGTTRASKQLAIEDVHFHAHWWDRALVGSECDPVFVRKWISENPMLVGTVDDLMEARKHSARQAELYNVRRELDDLQGHIAGALV